ncbi:polysaccharide pyruvyl transferase family protein [Clostridium sp. CF011]|uniref:polysaccharide pyruvyl transferase family protein n=1 Tax=Clostridium sp. CF011 TaxID=2843318 RepID=UPI001C0C16F6|nr:polysaccharide pyruvyl transferase family protein [Clostridium sp. CF011]MBU3093646.1 polysaccharide pyruvyl transferase family protein [Clostridium sp. CF011]WAG69348.1 polysaccharide pyruvyl transferase family protein [Clostridium sp. CF011]
MKKIGIITINDYKNYGNRLQNYASQEVLKSLGCKVETIINTPMKENKRSQLSVVNCLKKASKMSQGELIKKVVLKIKNTRMRKSNKESIELKIKAFKQFTRDNIVETPFEITKDNIPSDLADQYDYFVVGSDQVWNPTFRKGSPIDFLTFVPVHKRLAYAPSFGISEIPTGFVKNYRKWISEMAHLSVREQAGANIIKKLTGRDAVVLVDPTMMLSKEKWLSVSKSMVKKPQNKYLLTYFLGEVSKVNDKKISHIASENKLEIINLASMKDRARYDADPGEFIDYINSASVFLTDSFHGVVFSILLEKPFIIFDRSEKNHSMNSRIDTLLSIFNLQSRKLENIVGKDDIFDIDYSHVSLILEAERNKAFNYLKNALNIKSRF